MLKFFMITYISSFPIEFLHKMAFYFHEGLTPNVISYAVAMAAARDKPAVAVSLLERMKNSGIEPNTVVLTTAINSLAKGGGHYSGKTLAV